MRQIMGIIVGVLAGIFIGFFGVFNSVFSDGPISERLIAIAVILVIYGALSALWAFFLPGYGWQWGLFLGLPGVLILLLYMLREINPYYFIYMILIMGFSCLGAYGGNGLRKGR